MFQFLSGGIILRKLAVIVLCTLLLSGCAAEETFETIADELILPAMAQPREISVSLPDNALAPVLSGTDEQVYFCEDYEIIIETLSSGDLSATVKAVSGYEKEHLTILETRQENMPRYEFVWASAGEQGERLGRAVILDDGHYHYCMSVLRDAQAAQDSQIVWSEVFQSFALLPA